MSGASSTPSLWRDTLILSPKKRQKYEDRIDRELSADVELPILDDVTGSSVARPMEIEDSDEDDYETSDEDEFPSLDTIISKTTPTAARNVEIAPRRIPKLDFNPLPRKAVSLTKFRSVEALIKDAKEDEEYDKSLRAIEQLPPLSSEASRNKMPSDLDDDDLLDKAVHFLKESRGGDDEMDDDDKEKHYKNVRHAIGKHTARHAAPVYYFFAPTEDGSSTSEISSLNLGRTTTRSYGTTLNQLAKISTKYDSNPGPGIDWSDDVLARILNALPTEKSQELRAEYSQILASHPDQVSRLIDDNQIKQWFRSTGADEDAISFGSSGMISRQHDVPTLARDWTAFDNVLGLLRLYCNCAVRFDVLTHTTIFLLRASIDSEVWLYGNGIAVNETIMEVVSSVRRSDWEKFCRNVCSLFIQTVNSVALQSRAIEATRPCDVRLRNKAHSSSGPLTPLQQLHTWLQLSIFFNDAEKAVPERCGTASKLSESILQRLADPLFQTQSGREDRNYYDLDGYGLALTQIMLYLHSLRERDKADSAERIKVDLAIEKLRIKVSFVRQNIKIVGPTDDIGARSAARSRWQKLEYQMAHLFPRRGGAGIFGDETTEEELLAQMRHAEKQQNFMANYFKPRRVGRT